jgi:hypothetical protein
VSRLQNLSNAPRATGSGNFYVGARPDGSAALWGVLDHLYVVGGVWGLGSNSETDVAYNGGSGRDWPFVSN